jgi:ATP-binding cassette subfamily B protein
VAGGRLSIAVEYDLRNAMYAHLQRLSYRFFDRHQTGQLMSRGDGRPAGRARSSGYGLIFFSQHVITVRDRRVALSLRRGS